MFDPPAIVRQLTDDGVEFVVIGGLAATCHGCPEQTYDADILYADNPENRRRLLRSLKAIRAQWDAPLTEEVLARQPVFALNTSLGDLDIFSEVKGIGTYENVAPRIRRIDFRGQPIPILDLDDLIAAKEAAADPNPRKKAALEFLRELRAREP